MLGAISDHYVGRSGPAPANIYAFTSAKTFGSSLNGSPITEPIGRTIVVPYVSDNSTASLPVFTLSKPGGETNSWTYLQAGSSTSGANGGCRGGFAVITTTVAWTAFVPVLTLSGSTVIARLMCAVSFPDLTGALRGIGATGTSATVAATCTLTGTTQAQANDLVLVVIAREDAAPGTTITCSTGETVTIITSGATTGSSAQTNQALALGYISSAAATADMTFNDAANPATDNIAAALALVPV